jgi:hypothetical protein
MRGPSSLLIINITMFQTVLCQLLRRLSPSPPPDLQWHLQNAQGDQFVGRAIALVGFLNSWKFAVLPPHFVEDVTPVVLAIFPMCAAMPNMIPVCRLALAPPSP